MKNTLKEKFKNNILVKPLYRKLKDGNKVEPTILLSVDRTFKLDGHAINVKRNIVKDTSVLNEPKTYLDKRIFRCGPHYQCNKGDLFEKVNNKSKTNVLRKTNKMLSGMENKKPSEVDGIDDRRHKLVQADNQIVVTQSVNTWLRFYPLPKLPVESVRSVVFRCMLSQLGLFTVLVLWSVVWLFLIQSFEGPNEIKVSQKFEDEQNELVIDLATELRQITPLSPKWRSAIERRIQDERHLTIQAVSQGARVHPGQYWDLSGTFLFIVYVMTALGFGAPVPQTLWGRSSALIYAIFAVPTHIYLMLNASMCIVVHVEGYMNRLRSKLRDTRPFILGRNTARNGSGENLMTSTHAEGTTWGYVGLAPTKNTPVPSLALPLPESRDHQSMLSAAPAESPNCSRSSEVLKSPNRSGITIKIMRFISVLGACRSVPLAAVLYYISGAAAFGFARGNTSLDVIMFPLEFTTSGGLDKVKGHVRIFYGFYVEGAMMLLSCGLATLRRHSGAAVTCMAEKYRLFTTGE